MKVLVVSEGKHELGDSSIGEFGALVTLICRASTKKLNCTAMNVRDKSFSHVHGAGGKLYKRAMRALFYAAEKGFDAVVFVIDQDDDPERRQFLDRAQNDHHVGISRAFGLAIQTFDAWMLADERALAAALERPIQRQPDPEEIADAKSHCRALIGDAETTLTRLYESVSQNASINVIEQRCPKGFAPFVARIRRL